MPIFCEMSSINTSEKIAHLLKIKEITFKLVNYVTEINVSVLNCQQFKHIPGMYG